MYQRVGSVAYKADLSNTHLLADYLENPERELKCVHVAGTNGKGSTSHMLASVLQHAGYKVGLYTSPHLKDFRERIRINGEMIAENKVTEFVTEHRPFFEANSLSFFEMTVGLAFDYFRTEEIDIAVIEVGLGGRLDSTNIVSPEVSVITNIGMDHMQLLGNTLLKIASEKAGIIKTRVPVVIGERHPETTAVFEEFANRHKTKLYFAQDEELPEVGSDLTGNYQQANIRTCLTTLKLLSEKGWSISEEAIRNGLNSVVATTGIRGRWEQLGEKPSIFCDTAHNREGLEQVLKQLHQQHFEDLHIVLGVVDDKNLDHILPLFPTNAQYYFCRPDVPRGLKASTLALAARKYKLNGVVYASVSDAFESARRKAHIADLIFVGGSTFTVAEVL